MHYFAGSYTSSAGFFKKSVSGLFFVISLFAVASLTFANETAMPVNNAATTEKTVAITEAEKASVKIAEVGTEDDKPPTEVNAVAESAPVTSPMNTTSSSSTHSTPVTATKSVTLPSKTSSASQLASITGGLVLILALIYGLSWFVKRFSQGGFMHNPMMKVVAAMPLGTRERLMLVDVGGKQLLLGVTATQINTLHIFDEPIVVSEKEQTVTSDFSQKLMAILQQKNSSAPGSNSDKKFNS